MIQKCVLFAVWNDVHTIESYIKRVQFCRKCTTLHVHMKSSYYYYRCTEHVSTTLPVPHCQSMIMTVGIRTKTSEMRVELRAEMCTICILFMWKHPFDSSNKTSYTSLDTMHLVHIHCTIMHILHLMKIDNNITIILMMTFLTLWKNQQNKDLV